jgi:hypothetical protein
MTMIMADIEACTKAVGVLLHPWLCAAIFSSLVALALWESLKNLIHSWHQWLMPVILATQEAEIRRIVVWSQPGQIVLKTLSRKTLHKNRAGRVAKDEGPEFKAQQKQKQTKKPYSCMYFASWKFMHPCLTKLSETSFPNFCLLSVSVLAASFHLTFQNEQASSSCLFPSQISNFTKVAGSKWALTRLFLGN